MASGHRVSAFFILADVHFRLNAALTPGLRLMIANEYHRPEMQFQHTDQPGQETFCEEIAMSTPTQPQAEDQTPSTFLIAASPCWELFHHHPFPVPIERWLKEQHPEVQLEPVADSELESFDFRMSRPLFRLRLSETQLTSFLTAWHGKLAGQSDLETGIDLYELSEFGPAIIPPVLIDIDGKLLRSIEQIDQEEQPRQMFLIVPSPEWQYYHPYRLPFPLRCWFDRYLPHVRIEQTSGFSHQYGLRCDDKDAPTHTTEMTHPMFWANLSLDEAGFLKKNWPQTMFSPADGPCDFILFEIFDLPGRYVQEGLPARVATELRGSPMDGE